MASSDPPPTPAPAPELPKQYKACIYDQPGQISTKVTMLDMPEPGPGEVLVNLCVSFFPLPSPFRPSKQN